MKTGKEIFSALRIPLIVLGILLVFYIVFAKGIPLVSQIKADRSPIASIDVVNEKEYRQDSRIKSSDFKVTAVHENGGSTKVGKEEIILSKNTPDRTGKYTKLTVSLKSDKKISCEVEVVNRREEVIRFNCGTPDLNSVQAVLYDNGELCFEGKGDVLQFNEFPWIKYMSSGDGHEDNPVVSVTFDKDVEPMIMDGWFEDMDTIEYVGKIPSSVESLEGTFRGCSSLTEGADWSSCLSLKNVTEAYQDCENLASIPSLPAGVRIADRMCENCPVLSECPDMASATLLTSAIGMFKDCSGISSVSLSPKLQVMDEMFMGCINLKNMPEIPDTVVSMKNAFSGDISLSGMTSIPEKVTDLSGCFEECKRAEGELRIDANPSAYGSCFNGAVVGTKLILKGNSEMLGMIAEEADNANIGLEDGNSAEEEVATTENAR